MDIKIKKDVLLNNLRAIKNSTEKKTTIPILGYVKFEAVGDELLIEGTNLDVSSRRGLPVTVTRPGVFCVELGKLLRFIELAFVEEVRLVSDGNWINVLIGKRKHKLQTLPVSDFPKTISGLGELLELDGTVFGRLSQRVAFAQSNNTSRYMLDGVKIELCPEKIRLVATDGHRLSLTEHLTSLPIQSNIADFIPSKALAVLKKLSEESSKLSIGFQNEIQAVSGKTVFCARKQSGQFPNYEPLLGNVRGPLIEVDRVEFLNSLKAMIAGGDSKSFLVEIELNKDSLHCVSRSQDGTENEETLPIQSSAELEFKIGFNAQYLIDFLTVASTPFVSLRFAVKSPHENEIEMREVDGTDHWQYFVWPMRL